MTNRKGTTMNNTKGTIRQRKLITTAIALSLVAAVLNSNYANAYEVMNKARTTNYKIHKETASAWWNENGEEQALAVVSIIKGGKTDRQIITSTGCHPEKVGGSLTFLDKNGELIEGVEQMTWLRSGDTLADRLGAVICAYGVNNYNAANRPQAPASRTPASHTQRTEFAL